MRVWFSELVEEAVGREPDPAFDGVSDEELVEGFAEQASSIAAQTCQWLLTLAEIVRRGVWGRDGQPTPAAWLSWKVSMAPSTAREHVRVALALADWPGVTARFAAGRLSYSKVRVIVGCGYPQLEELLLRYAEYASGGELQRILSGFERTLEPAELEDVAAVRACEQRPVGDRMMEIRLRVPIEDGLAVWNALERRADQLAREQDRGAVAAAGDAAAAPPRHTRTALRADAAVEALLAMADGLPVDTSGQDRHLVVLHAHARATDVPLAGQDRLVPVEDDAGHTLPAMSSRLLRRLTCTGGARRVVHDDAGEVVDVADEQRRPTAKQRRQLWLRDRGCRFPGCQSRRGLHAHHIQHWQDGGPTELWNLVLMCGFHHRFVHEHGWTVLHDGRGRFRFQPPDGPVLPTVAPLPGADLDRPAFPRQPDDLDPDEWLFVRPKPLQARGDGGRPDYDTCILVLHQELERHREPDRIVVAA